MMEEDDDVGHDEVDDVTDDDEGEIPAVNDDISKILSKEEMLCEKILP